MEEASNLTGLAVVVLTALTCGLVMARFRQPALVGYLIAGVLLGPGGFQLVENREQVAGLAELGVLLLLFVIGMELSVRSLRFVWRIALTAAALQIAASVTVMALVAWVLDYPAAKAVLLGFVIALSSTAVAVKMLEETGTLRSRVGRITIAILIAQDLAFLPMLILVEQFGTGGMGAGGALKIAIAVGLLVLLVRVLIKWRKIDLPFAPIVVNHVDLSPLNGLVYCFGAGAAFGLIGLSPAYGAFLAGLVVGNSAQRAQMLTAVRPIQSILVMVFFLSIGLLIDLRFVMDHIGTVLLLLVLVTLFKTALNVAVLRFLRESWPRAFLGGLMISQVGEFSFLLAAAGLSVAAIGPEESKLVVSVTVLSLCLSPFWLAAARRFHGIAARQIPTLRSALDLIFGSESASLARLSAATGDNLRAALYWSRRRIERLRARGGMPSGLSYARAAAEPAPGPAPAPASFDQHATLAEIGEQVRRAANHADGADGAPRSPPGAGHA